MATKKIELTIVPENGRSSNTVWSDHQSYAEILGCEGTTLSALHYSGRAIIRSVQIGGEVIDQYSSAVVRRTSPISETRDLLRFLPLFQEYDLFQADIILVSIRKYAARVS
jgi:hypothetical protein